MKLEKIIKQEKIYLYYYKIVEKIKSDNEHNKLLLELYRPIGLNEHREPEIGEIINIIDVDSIYPLQVKILDIKYGPICKIEYLTQLSSDEEIYEYDYNNPEISNIDKSEFIDNVINDLNKRFNSEYVKDVVNMKLDDDISNYEQLSTYIYGNSMYYNNEHIIKDFQNIITKGIFDSIIKKLKDNNLVPKCCKSKNIPKDLQIRISPIFDISVYKSNEICEEYIKREESGGKFYNCSFDTKINSNYKIMFKFAISIYANGEYIKKYE